MTKILMVCLGNICRSPLAEGILRSKLPQDSFVVDSAGTANYHIDHRPDKRSVEIAERFGLDIGSLRGRQFSVVDFDNFDIIYVMDKSNYQHILEMTRNDKDAAKVHYILNEVEPHSDREVPDPYFGGHEGFESVYKMLDEACEVIAKKLNS